MPRTARRRSESGIYHVMVRGINRQDLFLDNDDKLTYLYTLAKVKERSGFGIYAYCLMSNHVHLLLAEGSEGLGEAMKRLGSSYVYWYNKKYERVGHLFQDRYLSEPIETDAYLLTALRYIHQNPVHAGLATGMDAYRWSSYGAFIHGGEPVRGLTDTRRALELVGGMRRFTDFHRGESGDDLLDIQRLERLSESEAGQVIRQALGDLTLLDLQAMDIRDRTELLRRLKALPGVSQRQIARWTGLSRNVVQRA